MDIHKEWKKSWCPFYISDDAQSIRCNSPLGERAEAVTEFEDAAMKERHTHDYCCSYAGHDSCPQYKINVLEWEKRHGKF